MRRISLLIALSLSVACGDKDPDEPSNNGVDDCTVTGCESPLACEEASGTCQPVKCTNDGDCDALTEYCDDGPGTCRELVLYRTCAFEQGSICSGGGTVSCVITDENEDCIDNAKQCATYEMSAPFCTKRCNSDEDCGDGTCVEVVPGNDELYCVPPA